MADPNHKLNLIMLNLISYDLKMQKWLCHKLDRDKFKEIVKIVVTSSGIAWAEANTVTTSMRTRTTK